LYIEQLLTKYIIL
jgi:penicillin-binding protein 1A